MNCSIRLLSIVAILTVGLSIGCGGGDTSPTPSPAAPAATQDHGHSHDHSPEEMEKVKAELAKLSPEDAALVETQHICPVSGELLGSMGPPKKVDVNGQPVWICCDGCRDALTTNSEKYLAKLKK